MNRNGALADTAWQIVNARPGIPMNELCRLSGMGSTYLTLTMTRGGYLISIDENNRCYPFRRINREDVDAVFDMGYNRVEGNRYTMDALRKVCVEFADTHYDAMPTMYEAAKLLQREGYEVNAYASGLNQDLEIVADEIGALFLLPTDKATARKKAKRAINEFKRYLCRKSLTQGKTCDIITT